MDIALLDTDIINEVLKQKNAQVVQHAAAYYGQHRLFALSAMSRYEVLRGLKEKQAIRQLSQFHIFCRNSLVLPINDAVLDCAADLWTIARRGGHPGRDADLIIAATAIVFGRNLVSGNTLHFHWIGGLKLFNWRDP